MTYMMFGASIIQQREITHSFPTVITPILTLTTSWSISGYVTTCHHYYRRQYILVSYQALERQFDPTAIIPSYGIYPAATTLEEFFELNHGTVNDSYTHWNTHKVFIRGILIKLGARAKINRMQRVTSIRKHRTKKPLIFTYPLTQMYNIQYFTLMVQILLNFLDEAKTFNFTHACLAYQHLGSTILLSNSRATLSMILYKAAVLDDSYLAFFRSLAAAQASQAVCSLLVAFVKVNGYFKFVTDLSGFHFSPYTFPFHIICEPGALLYLYRKRENISNSPVLLLIACSFLSPNIILNPTNYHAIFTYSTHPKV